MAHWMALMATKAALEKIATVAGSYAACCRSSPNHSMYNKRACTYAVMDAFQSRHAWFGHNQAYKQSKCSPAQPKHEWPMLTLCLQHICTSALKVHNSTFTHKLWHTLQTGMHSSPHQYSSQDLHSMSSGMVIRFEQCNKINYACTLSVAALFVWCFCLYVWVVFLLLEHEHGPRTYQPKQTGMNMHLKAYILTHKII
jgi:hypothetical protein